MTDDRDALGRTPFVSQIGEGVFVKHVAPGQEVCDFCLDPDPTWEYPAGEVDLPLPHPDGVNRSDDEWAACETCHALIERGLHNNLALHMVSRQLGAIPLIPMDAVELALMQIKAFTAARTGEARPFRS